MHQVFQTQDAAFSETLFYDLVVGQRDSLVALLAEALLVDQVGEGLLVGEAVGEITLDLLHLGQHLGFVLEEGQTVHGGESQHPEHLLDLVGEVVDASETQHQEQLVVFLLGDQGGQGTLLGLGDPLLEVLVTLRLGPVLPDELFGLFDFLVFQVLELLTHSVLDHLFGLLLYLVMTPVLLPEDVLLDVLLLETLFHP